MELNNKIGFTLFKDIDKKITYPFIFSLVISLAVSVSCSIISVLVTNGNHIPQDCAGMNVFCISVFSTVVTFCSTTLVQNFCEYIFRDKNDIKKPKIVFNIILLITLIIYMLFYNIYLLFISIILGITFIVFSAFVFLISIFSFLEVYGNKKNKNNISG